MKKLTYLILALLNFTACTKNVYNSHTSQNSLDWAGTYTGVLMDGSKNINSTLILNNDLKYELITGDVHQNGSFKWLSDGQRISLQNGQKDIYLFVGENYITQVKKSGKTINPDKYVLNKTDEMDITNKYWRLTELFGKPLVKADSNHEPHLLLNPETGQVSGFAGCNSITGEYELNRENLRIRFSKIAATLMACDNMEIEDKFMEALNGTDNYSTDGKILTLNRARMAPLAKFEVVYL